MSTRAVAKPPASAIVDQGKLELHLQPAGGGKFVRQDRLVAEQVRWNSNGRLSSMTCRYVLGTGGTGGDGLAFISNRKRVGDNLFIKSGDIVSLRKSIKGPDNKTKFEEWFVGRVGQERWLVQAGDDREAISFTVYGPELAWEHIAITGMWHPQPDIDTKIIGGTDAAADRLASNIFFSDYPVIFNGGGRRTRPGGAPNKAESGGAWRLNTGGEGDGPATPRAHVFDAPERRVQQALGFQYAATHWKLVDAFVSLIEVFDGYRLISPFFVDSLPDRFLTAPLGQTRVEGMSLLAALRRIAEPSGFGFAITPWQEEGQHRLIVFDLQARDDAGRQATPHMAPIRGITSTPTTADAAGQLALLHRVDFLRDSHNTRNKIVVIGGQKLKAVVLDYPTGDNALQPAWDTTDVDVPYALTSWGEIVDGNRIIDFHTVENTTEFNQLFRFGAANNESHRHVYRSFVWNEDGAFNEVTSNVMPNLSAFGTADGVYTRRPRPVRGTLLYDDPAAKAPLFPAMVQMGIQSEPTSWIAVKTRIWPDRAGFTVEHPNLLTWFPWDTDGAEGRTTVGIRQSTLWGPYGYLTLLHNTIHNTGAVKLVFRLIGSVECDIAVKNTIERRRESSWPVDAEMVVRDPRFQFHTLTLDESTETAEGDPWGFGASRHDTRDDSDELTEYGKRLRDAHENEVGHGSLFARILTRQYEVGMAVPHTTGRLLDLHVDSATPDADGQLRGLRSPFITSIRWQLDGANKTEMVLDTPLLRVIR